MSAPLADAKATPAVAFCFALNHLLRAEPWARERLAPFAGEAVELAAAPLPALRFTIAPEGLVAPGGADPHLFIKIKPSLLAGLARGEEHALRAVDVSGNARLANEVMHLVRHLRWDFEEDLAQLFGDVAAHRIAGALRGLAAWHADAARLLAGALADYAADERRWILQRGELEAHAAAVARLRDALERLDKRIARLG
ncbi:MAG: ubiquinone biosynthesis accessory factor UbiJ [Betaproteobacteria bacterium]